MFKIMCIMLLSLSTTLAFLFLGLDEEELASHVKRQDEEDVKDQAREDR
jgi:hypothetical protein